MDIQDIKTFNETELREFFLELGQKKFRADQVAQWVYNHGVESWDEMTNVSPKLLEKLNEKVRLQSLSLHKVETSADGTTKWAYKTHDGYFVETVLIPSETRNSVCVSTQVGCGMGCTFCRTSRMGLKRHLTAGEIIEQFIKTRKWLAENDRGPLSNIIFMGMGEPFHNFENVFKVTEWLHHPKYFQLSKRRITVSTSGLVPRIIEAADRNMPAQLAISLNGTNNKMRETTMPINKRYDLKALLDSVDYYIDKTGNGITFEYVLIKDLTCTPEAAKELIEIIKDRNCKVNAIVLNQSDDPNLHAPSAEEIEKFLDIARKAKKTITIRQPRGRDIKAACGQLAIHEQKVA
jgi:23S rRNA (adenine2503-C2)-methyltransferase